MLIHLATLSNYQNKEKEKNKMEREIIKATENFTKRDLFNTTGGISLQSLPKGTQITVTAVAIVNTENEKGEPTEVTVLVTPDTVISSISPVVRKQAYDLIDMMEDGNPITVETATGTSKGDRNYLTLKLV